jgi:hypothetical protein
MALFMIERTFAEAIGEDSPEEGAKLAEVNTELGVEWVQTFLTADRTRTYCLYESPTADLLREHASRLGFPIDSIIQVSTLVE